MIVRGENEGEAEEGRRKEKKTKLIPKTGAIHTPLRHASEPDDPASGTSKKP